ncbi:diphosphate--fructose-6-phosphate 1-phosphotransferase [Methyloceanibacter stevinii]|uniref:diphosphate--fructose-6-phosphate 1-phosphotransferase n=1 Tax=Methyloceanibacter stevinii TaxID=1774970 RepID=UPI0009F49A23|nr:diphosphate--fructose-6-phosphate 1-phosphotransferase [Methyloceanibacter stevinii]
MSDLPTGNAAIGQSGGPTAVINQSLVGVVEGLQKGLVASGTVKQILGMRHGVRGIAKDGGDLVDLTAMPAKTLEAVAQTPSAALGSTRDKPDEEYCAQILQAAARTTSATSSISAATIPPTPAESARRAARAGYEMRCFHVPKTIDNDLKENDHTPGFASAARFVTLAHMGDALDNASLGGIKINVVMGRQAGFLTAAASLARGCRETDKDAAKRPAPHLIYVPEVPFVMDHFLHDVDRVYSALGRCQIAVSEGIRDADGNEIGPQLMRSGEVDAHGNVQLSGSGALGDGLADAVKKALTPAGGKAPRVRADTFGYLQRCWPATSSVDAMEARGVGRHAAKLAADGDAGASITIIRTSNVPGDYRSEFGRADLSAVARHARHMPEDFSDDGNNISAVFYDYCHPLVGELPTFGKL